MKVKTPKAKDTALGQLQVLAVCSIRPAAENDKLYRPVDPKDPEIRALARSIGEHGLREALVVTRDFVILSGHRRFVACKLLGLKTIPCHVLDIFSTDPQFLTLLREHNRQRIKRIDEIAREEIVSMDPEEAHRRLVEHRRERAEVHANTIVIEGVKHRARITAAKEPLLQAILNIVQERRNFWPLDDRQIHYALLNDPPLIHASKPRSRYRNDQHSYRATIDLVTRARLVGRLAWEAVQDATRPVTTWNVFDNVTPFIRSSLDQFLKGYYRNLLQSQPNHIEIVGEKNTIAGVIRPVAADYCMPYTLGRGYSSLPPRHEMAKRFRQSGKEQLILLFLSDFDPEGEDIPHSFARSMRDDFGIADVVPIKVGLTAEQVQVMNLPARMTAKVTSSRYAKFTERHGENVFELEAVPPDRMQQILRTAIDGVLVRDEFNQEIDAEKADAAKLDGLRRAMQQSLGDLELE